MLSFSLQDDRVTDEIWLKCLTSIKQLYEKIYTLLSEFCLNNDDNEHELKMVSESMQGKEFISCNYKIFLFK